MVNPFTEEQKQQWKDKIQAQKTSGLSIKRWCRGNHVTINCFYYWRKRLFPDEVNSPRLSKFVELKDSNRCKLSLEWQGVHLELESTTLKQALHFLGKLTCS